MIKRIITPILLLVSVFCFAQNEDDALRYSYYNYIGDARFTAMGGAMGALGGNVSALGTNPAGIGVYRRSELMFTPNINLNFSGSDFYGTSFQDNKTNFNISNLGGVFVAVNDALEGKLKGRKLSTRERKKVKGWMSQGFAINLNRLATFHENYVLQGVNPTGSLAQAFAAQSNGNPPSALNPYGEALAYETFLTDTAGSLTNYQNAVPFGGTLQRYTSGRTGSLSEINFTFGANYNHKLYIGGTVGVPRVRYTERNVYTEADPLDTIQAVVMAPGFAVQFDSLRYRWNNLVRGSGINLKLGIIYRASERVKLGFALHSPSFIRITQDFEANMRTRFQNGQVFGLQAAPGQFIFNQTTPLRAIASVGFIFGKLGLLGIEYEYVGYNMNRLSSSVYNFELENQAVRTKFGAGHNLRIGGEARISQKVAWRAGFNYIDNPFRSDFPVAVRAFTASTGIGYRVDGFFMDWTYALNRRTGQFYPYNSAYTLPAETTYNNHSLMITLGTRF